MRVDRFAATALTVDVHLHGFVGPPEKWCRDHGDVFRLIRDELLKAGAKDEQVRHHEEELESLQDAIDWAQPGDLVIMLALGGAAPVQARLRELGAE